MQTYNYQLPNGVLVIYGRNVDYMQSYLDAHSDSVESLCSYCHTHNLHICYIRRNKTLRSLLEYLRIERLKYKHNVTGTILDLL